MCLKYLSEVLLINSLCSHPTTRPHVRVKIPRPLSVYLSFCFLLLCVWPSLLSPSHQPVWPDLAIYWTFGNFLKPLATINLPKSPTFLDNFCKGVKTYHFLVKSFLGNFYRHLAISFRSHCHQHIQLHGQLLMPIQKYKWGNRDLYQTLSLSLSLSLTHTHTFSFWIQWPLTIINWESYSSRGWRNEYCFVNKLFNQLFARLRF